MIINFMEKTISRFRLETLLNSTSGRFFTVMFIKKDGSPRTMNARKGVHKGLTGTGKPNGLHTSAMKVFDVKINGYRQINLDTVKWVKTGGVRYTVVG
jgi:hypothetical protein